MKEGSSNMHCSQPEFISDQHDSLLDISFFAQRSVLVFLWRPRMDPELVAGVERLVVLGGGDALEENLKQELLRQSRLRWRAVATRQPGSGIMMKHHSQGRIRTDVRAN
jgi:hypothetical protein